MELGELIKVLEKYPRNKTIKKGFGNPHSWRGVYSELAFEVVENTTVGDMLDAANSANGTTYTGWKGGDFTMGLSTEVHIEYEEGEWSDGTTLWTMFLELLLELPNE